MQQTKLQGVSVGLSGSELKLGDKAPEISLVAVDLSEVKVGGGMGKARRSSSPCRPWIRTCVRPRRANLTSAPRA